VETIALFLRISFYGNPELMKNISTSQDHKYKVRNLENDQDSRAGLIPVDQKIESLWTDSNSSGVSMNKPIR
jgi:hypothetical protein